MSDGDDERTEDVAFSFPDFGANFDLSGEDMMQLANTHRLPFTREFDGQYYVRERDLGAWGAEAYAEQLRRLGMTVNVLEREGLDRAS